MTIPIETNLISEYLAHGGDATGAATIQLAIDDAIRWHDGQFRKDNKTPYTTHPLRVAERLAKAGVTDVVVLKAALLHDVLEDCRHVGAGDIAERHGRETLSLVEQLTRPVGATRQGYAMSFGGKSPRAALIKLMDRADNLNDWAGMDPKFKPVYAAEGLQILTGCVMRWPHGPWKTNEGGLRYAWGAVVANLLDACRDGLGVP